MAETGTTNLNMETVIADAIVKTEQGSIWMNIAEVKNVPYGVDTVKFDVYKPYSTVTSLGTEGTGSITADQMVTTAPTVTPTGNATATRLAGLALAGNPNMADEIAKLQMGSSIGKAVDVACGALISGITNSVGANDEALTLQDLNKVRRTLSSNDAMEPYIFVASPGQIEQMSNWAAYNSAPTTGVQAGEVANDIMVNGVTTGKKLAGMIIVESNNVNVATGVSTGIAFGAKGIGIGTKDVHKQGGYVNFKINSIPGTDLDEILAIGYYDQAVLVPEWCVKVISLDTV